jgi:DNA processing protein
LVESAEDILEEMGADSSTPNETAAPSCSDTRNQPDSDDDLLNALGFGALGLDALQARTGFDIATLQARLMELEIHGQLSRLPGGLFQRLVRA